MVDSAAECSFCRIGQSVATPADCGAVSLEDKFVPLRSAVSAVNKYRQTSHKFLNLRGVCIWTKNSP